MFVWEMQGAAANHLSFPARQGVAGHAEEAECAALTIPGRQTLGAMAGFPSEGERPSAVETKGVFCVASGQAESTCGRCGS